MDPQLLNHLLQLAAKTGDRLIVIDPTSRQPFVLMGVAQYEALVGGVKTTLPMQESDRTPTFATDPVVTQANAELAAWRASQQAAPTSDVPATVSGFTPEPLQSAAVDDDRFYVEPLE